MATAHRIFLVLCLVLIAKFTGHFVVNGDATVNADDPPKVEPKIGKDASATDDEVVKREEEAIKLDGLNAAQMRDLRQRAKIFHFQAEVNRMMKLIINSLYKNKEIFLRELISNASDALDKIRLLSLTDSSQLDSTDEMTIKIKADKENGILHITDTGVGMTKEELVTNLGTIAKSGTAEFSKMLEGAQSGSGAQQQDLIGQFGVGFYSAFLVADRIVVTSKSNNDTNQWIWESDAESFSMVEDPRGNTLKRGTQISLHLKEESRDFLEPQTLKEAAKKYSQFITYKIFLWTSKTETVEEPVEEEEKSEKAVEEETDDTKVEEEKEEKAKTKKVEKTTWDWELINDVKPLWLRNADEVESAEYNEFYKSISKDYQDPLAYTHFTAEGDVTFKSILFIPTTAPHDTFQNYGKLSGNIKLYVRRVFITDDFHDMMPKYLAFIRGLVDSDDLPLNVSRETLQQSKLLKTIQKKLVRKVLDMIKKMKPDVFDKFYKEYSTNIKLGAMEDKANQNRLAKLLRFYSSHEEEKMTSLEQYVERMKEKQDHIYYVAGTSMDEVKKSPFIESLLKKGYEVLYLVEPIDEHCIGALPEFEGKKLQNVAKEGVKLADGEKEKEKLDQVNKKFEPLLNWVKDVALKDKIEKAIISQRLHDSPCALVANSYGWSGNMERIMRSQAYAKAKDPMQDFYANQKKILEINPRHPLIKELLERVISNKEDALAKNSVELLYNTAVIRSGFLLSDAKSFADQIERMLKSSLNVNPDEPVEAEPEETEPETAPPVGDKEFIDDDEEAKDDKKKVPDEHVEL